MGFVKTGQELARYYGLGVRTFTGARMIGVMFSSEPAVVARLLPPPLEQPDLPGGLIFIADYPKTNLGPGYREGALFLRCKYKAEAGSYCLSMPITSEPRMHNGRDVFGFPKKLANIHLEREGNRVSGWVERYGIRFVEIAIALSGSIPELPPMGPTFLFKAMPKIDLTPGFDGPVLLARQQTEIRPRRIEIGTAELTLRPSEHDPWSEIGKPEVLAAFSLESDNTMLPGTILGEVDPQGYLPHYYKVTDFTAGE
ncbi:MAG: acetoacetate decarboxylase family protein [bacterium]